MGQTAMVGNGWRSWMFLLACVVLTGGGTTPAVADLEAPAGRPILTVTGAITHTNAGDTAVFDRTMIDALPTVTLTAETPWLEGPQRFEGPRLRDILAAVGATGTHLRARALNDYEVIIPMADALDYDVILATRLNGRRLRTRDYGPLWVIYPWGDHPVLQASEYFGRSIWQLEEIDIE